MKRNITFIKRDGQGGISMTVPTDMKITVKDTLVGDDAVFETTYSHAFIEDVAQSGDTLILKIKADFIKTDLRSTK